MCDLLMTWNIIHVDTILCTAYRRATFNYQNQHGLPAVIIIIIIIDLNVIKPQQKNSKFGRNK